MRVLHVHEVPQEVASHIVAAFREEISAAFGNTAVSKLQSGKVIEKLSKAHSTGHAAASGAILASAGLAAEVKLSKVTLGTDFKQHVIKSADYVQALAAQNKLCNLTGGQPLRETLLSFWDMYQRMAPGHPALKDGVEACEFSVPILLFGDEGRALKKQAAMVLGWEPVLGYGCMNQCEDPEAHRGHMLSFSGSTYKTRVLHSILHKRSYGKKQKHLIDLIGIWAADHEEAKDGVDANLQGKSVRIKLIPIGLKADWAAEVKLGQLNRSFYHDATPFGKGLCHVCMANTSECPQWTTNEWQNTMGESFVPPWTVEPALVQKLCCGFSNDWEKAAFFKMDLFHICHKGTMAELAGSGIVPLTILKQQPLSV